MIRRGFTLIELLVVIGVLVVLLGVLLPVLVAVRRRALQVACLSQQRQVVDAATAYANRHDGFLPLCGDIVVPLPGGIDNAGLADLLNDRQRRRYRFSSSANNPWLQVVVPPDLALAADTGDLPIDTSPAIDSAYQTASRGFLRIFQCPSLADAPPFDQMASVRLVSSDNNLGYVSLYGASRHDYAFNGWVTGFDCLASAPVPLAGKLSQVRRPASVVLLSDAAPVGNFLVWFARRDHAMPSLAHALTQPALSAGARFDSQRHRGTVNITFVDGHAENIRLDERSLLTARLEQ